METVLARALSAARKEAEGISPESFDQIMRQHQRRVYGVIFRLVRDADTAGSLTQECFLRAHQKLATFRGECRIETWLLRIAVNLVRDHGKNRKVSFWRKLVGLEEATQAAQLQPRAPQPSAERILLAREQLDAVWSAVGSLSRQQRVVFLLRFAEELSLPEIAEVLGVRVGSVKAQLSRATEKMRKVLKER